MAVIHHNKLVRDRIPEIITRTGSPGSTGSPGGTGSPGSTGKSCITRTLDTEEYLAALDAKLNEELAEYQADKSMEELADLLEVMMAVAEARGHSFDEVEAIRREKAEKRGGFSQRIWLESVTD